MRIGFTGPHGTGKTTAAFEMATALKKEGYDVSIKSNVARNCPLPINEQSTVNSQLWIIGKMMTKEIESKSHITISDRTLLDALAYTRRVDSIVAETLEQFVRGYMRANYDFVFYLKPLEEKDYLIADGRRSTNKQFQTHIDFIIKKYIHQMGLDVKLTATTDERVKMVLEAIP